MQKKKGQVSSVVTPHLSELIERHEANSDIQNPSLMERPQKPADLLHDAGGAYNSNSTYLQQ